MEGHRFRILFFALLVLAFLGTVAYRLVQLQILNGERYLAFSQANSFREIPIPAPRGRILDRNGRVLAENKPRFVLTLNLAEAKQLEGSIETLAYLLEQDPNLIQEEVQKKRPASLLLPIVVAEGLSHEQVARIRARMTTLNMEEGGTRELNGIELGVRFDRIYPFHEKIGHILGYVKEVGEKDLKKWEETDPGRVSPGDAVGVAGAERSFDALLRGHDGFRQIIVDAKGREADLGALGIDKILGLRPARGGKNLELTLDAELNQAAYDALEDRVGAIVAVDPRDGGILAWVSRPSYDPQDLSGRISPALWESLRDHPDKILLNRPIQASYPPGSTHKILTAVAALAYGKTDLKETVHCPGYYQQGNRQWGCWNKKGHGKVDLKKAITVSCDVYFYKMGERLGPDPIALFAKLLGLGRKTGILADAEREGLIPTEAWKKKTKEEPWAPSDNLGTAIGQGYNLVTPLQNALMIAQFANGGKSIHPHLLRARIDDSGGREVEPSPKRESLPLKLSTVGYQAIKGALVEVVNAPGGTGTKARLKEIEVGGKTGTAQVIGHDSKAKVARSRMTENHAWFVAFAPAEDPEIALAVLVEHGGGGGAVAAPIAKRVLEAYFKNKNSNPGIALSNN